MFTLANSIAVSMYLIGFCESLLDMLEQYVGGFTSILNAGRINDIRLISCITLCLILGLAIVGMDWVTRVQMGLLASFLIFETN
jgi:solute carrier family 12 sodium/potassium/chloride transporter 2